MHGPSSHRHRATAWRRHRAARAGGGWRRRAQWGEPSHQHQRILRPVTGHAGRGYGDTAGPAFGAFGGAPYGATKRVRGVPKWVRWCKALWKGVTAFFNYRRRFSNSRPRALCLDANSVFIDAIRYGQLQARALQYLSRVLGASDNASRGKPGYTRMCSVLCGWPKRVGSVNVEPDCARVREHEFLLSA